VLLHELNQYIGCRLFSVAWLLLHRGWMLW